MSPSAVIRLRCLLPCLLLLASTATAQKWRQRVEDNPELRNYRRNEPAWLSPGVSFGVGGQQYPIGFTFDLHYGPATLRLHPGYWHWGVSGQYYFDIAAGVVSPRQRPLFVAAGFLQTWDWALPDMDYLTGRQRAYVLIGQRLTFSRPGDVYFEYGLGLMVRWDFYERPGQPPSNEYFYLPTAEVRLGLAFLSKRWLPRAGRPLFRSNRTR